jgi:hypothetical protein
VRLFCSFPSDQVFIADLLTFDARHQPFTVVMAVSGWVQRSWATLDAISPMVMVDSLSAALVLLSRLLFHMSARRGDVCGNDHFMNDRPQVG